MSTSAAASKLLRLSNIPLHTLLRAGTTSAAAQLFTFNTTKTSPQNPEEFKPNWRTETLILQPNGQNPFGLTAAVDQSKASIVCRRMNKPDEEDEDSYVDSDDDYNDDDHYDDPRLNNDDSESEFDDDFRESDDDDEDVKPRKR